MGRSRFTVAATHRLELSEGDWVEVKTKLSYGEQAKLTGTMTPSIHPGDTKKATETSIDVDWAEYAIQKMLAYIVDWSFVDANGKHMKVGRDTIFALDQETVAELEPLIDAFVVEQQEKKVSPPIEK